MTYSSACRPAITRVEVVVLLGVGVLLACAFALAMVRLRENGPRLQCMDNLRRIGNGVQSYADNAPPNRDLPPARIALDYATWAVLIMPHIAQEHPLQKWDVSNTYFAQDASIREAIVTPYFCPARPRPGWHSVDGDIDPATHTHLPGGLGDYGGVAGTGDPAHPWDGRDADGSFVLGEVLERQGDRLVRWRGRVSVQSIEARGLSVTLLIGEKHVPPDGLGRAAAGDGSLYNGKNAASCSRVAGPGHGLAVSVTEPFNNNFGSAHSGFCNFLYADGSVRPIAVDVNEAVLGRLARRGK
jgi:prepilin-type processing-associated H-X9-DG protein